MQNLLRIDYEKILLLTPVNFWEDYRSIFSRDSKTFDHWAQFFANKGYAVLQINFKGEEGRILNREYKNMKKWATEMGSDITDGVQQLINTGVTDPNQVCVVGISYAGYVALSSIINHPDLYRCAVSVNNVDTVLDQHEFHAFSLVDKLNSQEPTSKISAMKEARPPILLINGKTKKFIETVNYEPIIDVFENFGEKIYLVNKVNNEDFFDIEINRVAAFVTVEKFLDKNLPVKP